MNTSDSSRTNREKKTLEAMIQLYCSGHEHDGAPLCADCSELLEYALARLEKCPFGADKPKCSQCTVHCYKPEMRELVRKVMRYAGPRMIGKHPILAVHHVIDGVVHKADKPKKP